MILTEEISKLIGGPENELLEYKAVLPPAKTIAQIISAFANTKGGFLILGVVERHGEIIVNGLGEDFHANSVTHKAIDLLSPKPSIIYDYVTYGGKRLYVIKIEKSTLNVSLEDKIYIRSGDKILIKDAVKKEYKQSSYHPIVEFADSLTISKLSGTEAKSKFAEHYLSVLNILDNLKHILYPIVTSEPTADTEGRILMRILFSSCADNFETYLSDLLYEVYLALPSTLKTTEQVTIKEVLSCSDLQEFVEYWSKKKLSKLQRGSVKGFINETPQIKDLNVISAEQQAVLEKLLQIRHLYAHRNGIIDEKFLQFYPGQYNINEEHRLSVDEFLNNLSYLATCVNNIDNAAIQKYHLATID